MRTLIMMCLAAALVAETPPLPSGEKIDKYQAKPAEDGYRVEIILPAGVSGNPSAAALSPELMSAVTLETLAVSSTPRKTVVHIGKPNLPAGDYTLELLVPAGKTTYQYPITITIPAITLQALPAKIQFDQTYVPGLGSCGPFAECTMTIPVAPADPRSWLTGVGAAQAAPFLRDATVSGGSLQLGVKPADSKRGDPNSLPKLTITANDDFGMGESSGNIRISADQFAQPVSIPVTVVRRLTSAVLLPVLIGGLLLGWLVRIRMENRIEKLKMQVEAQKLSDEIEKVRQEFNDEVFTTALGGIRDEIAGGMNETADALKTKIGEWKGKFDGAFKEYNDRRDGVVAAAGRLRQIVGWEYKLPAELKAAVEQARGALDNAMALAAKDAGKAETERAAAEKSLFQSAKTAVAKWDEEWQRKDGVYRDLIRLPAPADVERLAAIKKPADDRERQVAEFAAAAESDADGLKSTLDGIHLNFDFWPQFTAACADAFEESIKSLNRMVAAKQREKAKNWLDWDQDARAVLTDLRAGKWATSDRLRALPERLPVLIRDWAAGISGEQLESLDNDLGRNDFLSAIRRVPVAVRDAVAKKDTGQEAEPGPPAAGVVIRILERTAATAAPPPPAQAALITLKLPELEATLNRVQSMQRLIAGILIVLAGWAILRQSFTGAALDYLTAFGWAFLTDVTSESLLTAWQPFKERVKL